MSAPVTPPKRKLLTLGPGSLVLGAVGTELDLSCQLTNLKVAWEVDAEDPEPTLCGDVVGGARTYTATLSGTVFQDVETDGVIDYTWKHKGAEVPFKFVPDSTGTAAITGTTVIDPIELGGDVRTRNKSDFEWSCIGEPVFNPVSGDGGTAAAVGTGG